jgi:hypothetical protein
MKKELLVNLEEALEAIELGKVKFKWLKYLTGINRKRDDGWSLLGDFCKKTERKALQLVGLYLMFEEHYNSPNPIEYRCWLLELGYDGKFSQVFYRAQTTKDWAVELWEPIQNWFDKQEEIKAKVAKSLTKIPATAEQLSMKEGAVVLGGKEGVFAKLLNQAQNVEIAKGLVAVVQVKDGMTHVVIHVEGPYVFIDDDGKESKKPKSFKFKST